MKIECIRTYHVRHTLPEPFSYSQLEFTARNSLLVEVIADGISGWGEAYSPADVAQAAVTGHYAPLLLGRDAEEIEILWHLMWQSSIDFARHGPMMGAISALDMALWDLKGKSLGVPVWNLMGGRFRDAIPCYITRMYFQDLPDDALIDTLIAEASGFCEQGYNKLKIKVGRTVPFDLELVARMRQALPDATLMADANHAYDLPEAIRVGQAMDAANFSWFEEPLSPQHPDMFPLLHSKLNLPLATGEAEQTRYGFQRLLAPGGVQIAQPDLAYCGGPSEALKIRAVASSMGINVIPHVWGTMFNFAAATHFLASAYGEPGRACALEPVLEYDRTPNALRDEMFETPVEIQNQCAVVPNRPGLGVTIDRKSMQSFLVRETESSER